MNINLFENISGLGLQDGIWETCDEIKDEIVMKYEDIKMQKEIKKREKDVIESLIKNDSTESIKREKAKFIAKREKEKNIKN